MYDRELNRRALESLIKAGSFDSMHYYRCLLYTSASGERKRAPPCGTAEKSGKQKPVICAKRDTARQQCSSFAFRCRMAECRLRSEEILPARQGHKRVDICADAARAHKRVDTVSYTHLDVYKRQGFICVNGLGNSSASVIP